MPLPLLIPLATTAASAAISYFSSSSQYEQQKDEAERRRQALEDAKITASEKREGIQNITRTSQNTAAESLNRYAFANRGVQSNQAKGAFMGQLNAGMLSSINQYEQSTLNYNKNIDMNIAGIGNPIDTTIADTGAGALAGLQTGMTLMDMYGDDFAGAPDAPDTANGIPDTLDDVMLDNVYPEDISVAPEQIFDDPMLGDASITNYFENRTSKAPTLPGIPMVDELDDFMLPDQKINPQLQGWLSPLGEAIPSVDEVGMYFGKGVTNMFKSLYGGN